MRYCLLRIAYDDSFHGFQSQPNVRTVQGEILKALAPVGVRKVYGSSRTDSHVRSASSIIEVEYPDVDKICRIVDSIKGIAVMGFYQTDEFVNLRRALEKEYLYVSFLSLEAKTVRKVIAEFLEGNLESFSKDPTKKVEISRIRFFSGKSHTIFVFYGKSFSWNFVRIAAESIIRRSQGKIDDEEWLDLLYGRKRARYKGKAENLILYRTRIPFELKNYESRNLVDLKTRAYQDFYWLSGLVDGVSDLTSSLKFLREP
jgi:tRNA pseudouridine38-40 synthase